MRKHKNAKALRWISKLYSFKIYHKKIAYQYQQRWLEGGFMVPDYKLEEQIMSYHEDQDYEQYLRMIDDEYWYQKYLDEQKQKDSEQANRAQTGTKSGSNENSTK